MPMAEGTAACARNPRTLRPWQIAPDFSKASGGGPSASPTGGWRTLGRAESGRRPLGPRGGWVGMARAWDFVLIN